MSELFNTLVSIVHCKSNSTFSLKFINKHSALFSVFSLENNLKSSWLINFKICGLILISKSVSSNYYRFFPARNESWNVANYDGLSKYGSIEDISDGSIWTFPHLFQLELFDSCLIWGDCSALDSNLALLDSFCSIQGDLIISLIPILNSKIKVFDVEIQER
jgi:hypothetical protein